MQYGLWRYDLYFGVFFLPFSCSQIHTILPSDAVILILSLDIVSSTLSALSINPLISLGVDNTILFTCGDTIFGLILLMMRLLLVMILLPSAVYQLIQPSF